MCNTGDILYCIYKNGRWLLVEDDPAFRNEILALISCCLKICYKYGVSFLLENQIPLVRLTVISIPVYFLIFTALTFILTASILNFLLVFLSVCYVRCVVFLKVFDYHFCRAFAIVSWFTGIIFVHWAFSFSQFDHGPVPGGIQTSCYTWSLQGLFTTAAKTCSFRSSPGVTTRSVLCIYVYNRMCEIRLTWMTM